MSTWTVLKFGGSSLKDASRLERVVERVRLQRSKTPVAVIVSAPGNLTNRILDVTRLAESGDAEAVRRAVKELRVVLMESFGIAEPSVVAWIAETLETLEEYLTGVRILGECTPRMADELMSYGERFSSQLVAERLRRAGLSAQAVDARGFLRTDSRFGEASVERAETQQAIAALEASWSAITPVITGFIGADDRGRTTTLGREGSDYTAALVAHGLNAHQLEIWTDVSGVYTADPALVSNARPLSKLTYGEALELSTFGARVMHERTMIPLIDAQIPMVIRNTLNPSAPGTRIDASGNPDTRQATSVTSLEDQALLDLRFRQVHYGAQISRRVHRALEAVTDRVWLSTHAAHGQSVSVVIPAAVAQQAKEALYRVLGPESDEGILAPIRIQEPVSVVTVVAESMGKTPNVAGRFFSALGTIGINVLSAGQSASARSISAVVHQDQMSTAIRAVHDAFHLDRQQVSLSVLGHGVVGGALLRQIEMQRSVLRGKKNLDLRLVGVSNSQGRWLDEVGLDPSEYAEAPAAQQSVAEHLDWLSRQPTPILVDCTASGEMMAVHRAALAAGIHVVTANKKPLASTMKAWDGLQDVAQHSHRSYRFETTVGAALPVVETIRSLVETGDQIHRVEGSLSGTLGFVVNRLSDGISLDVAVLEAQERGFTEPHPGEDLSGQDVLRKALILARSAGFQVESEDVELTPLVPNDVIQAPTLETFYEGLKAYAPKLRDQLEDLHTQGSVLRYLAVLDVSVPGRPRLQVGPTPVSKEHPAARLRGAEAFVAFTTDRYQTWPLLIQGPGAGGDVTASGVLTDVLRIADGLRGHHASGGVPSNETGFAMV